MHSRLHIVWLSIIKPFNINIDSRHKVSLIGLTIQTLLPEFGYFPQIVHKFLDFYSNCLNGRRLHRLTRKARDPADLLWYSTAARQVHCHSTPPDHRSPYISLKPGFHYPSWRPELTARVDGWPVSITRQHELTARQLGIGRYGIVGFNVPINTL